MAVEWNSKRNCNCLRNARLFEIIYALVLPDFLNKLLYDPSSENTL